MVNEEKVKLMTQMAIYESTKGKEQLPVSKYYKSDYVKFHMLKTAVAATFAYALILTLYGLLHAEELLEQINGMDYLATGKALLLSYAIVVVIYVIIAWVIYSIRYERIKPDVIKYNRLLKKTAEYYKQERAPKIPKTGVVLEERRVEPEDDYFTDNERYN